MLIRIPRGWEIPERDAASESAWVHRREIVRGMGLLGAASLLGAAEPKPVYPAKRNAEFTLDRPLTAEWAATSYNNFYEFHPTDKSAVKDNVGKFKTKPWAIEVKGLVAKPQTLDFDRLLRTMPFEERLYRFRCVERWAMAVPWTGFPMSALIKLVEPKPEAKYLRFVTVSRPDEMPGMRMASWYKWPYYEALRMDEAMNPMAMFVTGIYGKPLPAQNGAPFRAITPWKYGYKNPKSIVTIEFTASQPHTFWNDFAAKEYGFYSNINPGKPHPRWSQEMETLIPNGEPRKTQIYNGYAKWVGAMYRGDED